MSKLNISEGLVHNILCYVKNQAGCYEDCNYCKNSCICKNIISLTILTWEKMRDVELSRGDNEM